MRGSVKAVYVITRDHKVSLIPRARIIIYSGLTIATGGNIDDDRTNKSMKPLYITLSFANPNAHREPSSNDKIMEPDATVPLLNIIRKKGYALKRDV